MEHGNTTLSVQSMAQGAHQIEPLNQAPEASVMAIRLSALEHMVRELSRRLDLLSSSLNDDHPRFHGKRDSEWGAL